MEVINARNPQQALPEALYRLAVVGVSRPSRNGPVIVFPSPVTTVYSRPTERVLFWAERDANPFFHLAEALWMLDGRRDVAFVAAFAANMRSFSDDGETLHGAYGYRWREHFDLDQLPFIIEALKNSPEDRRQVLGMWDPLSDLGRIGKDLPCNLLATFQVNAYGELDMVVSNRSNDMIWGAYGANAVHFSVLQEFMAAAVGVNVGKYWQVSSNFHCYNNELYERVRPLHSFSAQPYAQSRSADHDPYAIGSVRPFPLVSTPWQDWLVDLKLLFEGSTVGMRDPFFLKVALPVIQAHKAWRKKQDPDRFKTAREIMEQCEASDWKRACNEWLTRREVEAAAKEKVS